jgi:hypothetical protein
MNLTFLKLLGVIYLTLWQITNSPFDQISARPIETTYPMAKNPVHVGQTMSHQVGSTFYNPVGHASNNQTGSVFGNSVGHYMDNRKLEASFCLN